MNASGVTSLATGSVGNIHLAGSIDPSKISGTAATLSGTETLANKTIDSPTFTGTPYFGLGNIQASSLELASGCVLIGNDSGNAAAQTVSGVISMNASGVTSLATGSVGNIHLAGSIDPSKISGTAATLSGAETLANKTIDSPTFTGAPYFGLGNIQASSLELASGCVLIGNASGNAAAQTVSGVISMNASGVTSLSTGSVGNIHLAGSIDPSKITNTAVTLSDTQTLINKTLTAPTITDPTLTGNLTMNGNVLAETIGVATQNPSANLHVVGTTLLNGAVTIDTAGSGSMVFGDGITNNTSTLGMKLAAYNSTYGIGIQPGLMEFISNNASTADFRWGYGTSGSLTETMFLDQGTQTLSVNNLTLDRALTVNNAFADVDTQFKGTSDANLFYLDSSTNRIGIGTDTPGVKLHIEPNAGEKTLGLGRIWGQASIVASSSASSGWLIMDSTGVGSVGLNFYDSGDVSLANGGGGVAIGQSSPGSGMKLDVLGSINASSNITSATNVWVSGHNAVDTGLVLGTTLVTATAAELNKLDGLTATTAELNAVAGFTGNTSELNYLDGVVPGTVSASNAMVVDSSLDLTGLNNLTLTGAIRVDDTTDSTSATTGSIQTDGGLGVAGNIFIGGNIVRGTTAPKAIIHLEGATSGAGTEPDSVVYIKQQTAWGGTEPWALYVDGYSNLGGFRINAADGIRSLYKASGQIGFATGDASNITFTQNSNETRLEIEATSGNTIAYKDLNVSTGNIKIPGHDGSSTGLVLGGTLVTATAAELNSLSSFSGNSTELNYLDSVITGTASTSKALVLDASKDISGINNMTLTGAITVDDTTDSTSTTTGSIQTDGGLGVAKSVVIGADLTIDDELKSTDGTITLSSNIISSGNMTHDLGSLTNSFRYIYSQHIVLTSDERKKTNIEDLNYGLDEVLKLRPVSYRWKHEEGSDRRSMGLIAQDVQGVIKENVHTQNDAEKSMGVDYISMVPVLIKAIQEQNEMIKKQEEQIQILKEQLSIGQ
jgi:hypothetical protein